MENKCHCISCNTLRLCSSSRESLHKPMFEFNSSTVPYASMRRCDFGTLVPPISEVVPLSPVLVYILKDITVYFRPAGNTLNKLVLTTPLPQFRTFFYRFQ